MKPLAARSDLTGFPFKPLVLASLFVMASFILINGGLYEARQSSALLALKTFVYGEPGTDSWLPMRVASEWLTQQHSGTLYQDVFFGQNIKFQYPLSSLLLFSAFDSIGVPTTNALFNSIAWIAVFVTAVAVAIQAAVMMRGSVATRPDPIALVLAMGLAVFATLTFYPILKSYSLGQAQTWINAAFAIAVVCWLIDRRLLTGLLIGLICMIKPQFALFALWGLLRRQWGFVAGMAIIGVPLTALATFLYGFDNQLDYLTVLQFLTSHGESYFANQSINGLLHRLTTGGFLEWKEGFFPRYMPAIHYATMLWSAVILLLALFYRPKGDSGHALDFLTAAISFTIASPVAWDHHYGILVPVFVALLFALLAQPKSRQRTTLFAFLGIAFMVSANFFPLPFGCDGPGSLIQSYLLFASLIVLWLLYKVRADRHRPLQFVHR